MDFIALLLGLFFKNPRHAAIAGAVAMPLLRLVSWLRFPAQRQESEPMHIVIGTVMSMVTGAIAAALGCWISTRLQRRKKAKQSGH